MDSRYPQSWMWSDAVRVLDQAQRLSQQFFQLQNEQWEPPVDVYETEEQWIVLVALPGVAPEHIRYRLEGDCLDVMAERTLPASCGHGAIRRKEIPHGRFSRRLRFARAPHELTEASYEDGCLLLKLSKTYP